MNSAGKTEPLLAPGANWLPRLSPDGKRLALTTNNKDIEVYDWERDRMTKLTFAGPNQLSRYPVWTPDGKHIVFTSLSPNGSSLEWIRSDGAGESHPVMQGKSDLRPYSFSPDGKRLAFAEATVRTGLDVWTLLLDLSDPEHPKAGKPELFLGTMSDEFEPAFSPDGRWIAYRTNASGPLEVYVQPFPGPGGRWLIGAGRHPVWSANGRELFYFGPDNRIMVTTYSAKGDSFSADKARAWSDAQILEPNVALWNMDLAPDGKRFVVAPRPETRGQKGSVHVTVLLNFFDELRRRLPPSGR
jgi:serine/threonine-protein kinase